MSEGDTTLNLQKISGENVGRFYLSVRRAFGEYERAFGEYEHSFGYTHQMLASNA